MTNEELLEAQRALEDESRALGVARYRKNREASWQNILDPNLDEASLPPNRRLLRRYLGPTRDAISEFMDGASAGKAGRRHTAHKLLPGAAPIALAFLTLRSAINSGSQRLRLQRASLNVADAVLLHLRTKAFQDANHVGAAGLQLMLNSRGKVTARTLQLAKKIQRKEGVAIEWTLREKLLVGVKLLELARDATGLFDWPLLEEGFGARRRKHYEFRLTEVVDQWLERQHERAALLDPIPLPMVVPPQPWETASDGGYLDPPPGNCIVRTKNPAHLALVEKAQMPQVLRAVNFVQATAWKVNQPVLGVMRQVWAEGGTIGGLPPRDRAPLPAKPLDFDTNEAAKKAWKQLAALVHAENARRTGKRATFVQKLSVAEKLVDFPAIYFPHNLDWRGRCYPIPKGGPEPQGNDIARGLLTFAQGLPLGSNGGWWLAIHLANQFGIDKVSFEDRVAWVRQHQSLILDSADRPLDGHRFWAGADNPWQALAACFEWAGYVAQGDAYVSHLPISLDGSNSGLQHFTALLRDPIAAPHVNLLGGDRPGDIYAHIAELAQEKVERSSDERARPWKGGRITRGIAKEPCMTYVYSARRKGMAEQIESALRLLDISAAERGQPPHLGGADNRAAAYWLAGLFEQLLRSNLPAIRNAMNWLQTTSNLVSSANLAMQWTSPVGLPIVHEYRKLPLRTVEVCCGRTIKLQVQDEESEGDQSFPIDRGKAANGIAANFIHSLDATHLMLVASACADQGIPALAVIHDSFGTHAANTGKLATILRETFVDLYKRDPLGQLRDAVLEQLNGHPELAAQVPPVPPQGDFELEKVLDSTYMFA